jgi:hypothetical protein
MPWSEPECAHTETPARPHREGTQPVPVHRVAPRVEAFAPWRPDIAIVPNPEPFALRPSPFTFHLLPFPLPHGALDPAHPVRSPLPAEDLALDRAGC